MKHKKMDSFAVRQPIYPNAADERYFTGKALEILAAIISGLSAVTTMLIFATMA